MPIIFDEALDTPLVFDGQRQFSGGEDSKTQARILGENQCTSLVNVELDENGLVHTRLGLVLTPSTGVNSYISGLASYRNTTVTQMVAFFGGNLKYLSTWATGWQTGASSAYTSGNRVYTATVADKLYFIDGSAGGQLKYWDGSAVTTVPTTGAVSAPAGINRLISTRGRLFAVTASNPDTLYVGDFLTSNFDVVTNAIRIGGDSSPITAIVEWTGDRIAVFKENRVFVVSGITQTSAGGFSVETVENANGALSQSATLRVGSDVMFMSRDGVRLLSRTLQGKDQAVSLPISLPIEDKIKQIDITQPSEISIVFHENTVILSAKTVAGGTITVAFDTVNRCWLGEWSGRFYPYSGVQASNGITLPNTVAATALFTGLVIGDRSGRVYLWRRGHNFGSSTALTYSDDGSTTGDGSVSIPTLIASRGMTFSEAGSRKLGNRCEIEFYESDTTALIEYIMDNDHWETLATILTSAAPLTLPFNLPKYMSGFPALKNKGYTIIDQDYFREIILRVSSSSGYLAVRGMSVSAYLQPYLVT
jgi:hypothetical protein